MLRQVDDDELLIEDDEGIIRPDFIARCLRAMEGPVTPIEECLEFNDD